MYTIALYLICFAAQVVWAQRPVSVAPAFKEELISLQKDTAFDQAIRVIQSFSSKVIVYPQLTDPIGINIDREPWNRALEQIAAHNGLQIDETNRYLQVVQSVDEVDKPSEIVVPEVSADSREVNISATFFQADRSVLRDLGIDWSTLSGGRVDISAQSLGADRVLGEQFLLGARFDGNRSMSVEFLFKSLESRNVGKIIARPQIKVRSGKRGHIQVGSDFSVTTSDFAGNAINQFFSTGTILTVTPVIFVEEGFDFVDLKVVAERSALIDPQRNLINKTVAETTILLQNGEQTAIGGLFGHEVTTQVTGVPILKDLPVWLLGLRYLFRHESRNVVETDLIVMLRTDIVPSVRERARAKLESFKPGDFIEKERNELRNLLEE